MRTSIHFTTALCIVILILGINSSSPVDNIHYVGCYDPSYALRQRYHYHIPSISLAECVQKCQVFKTRFAGVEASDNLCYCGADIGEMSIQRNNTLCNIPCTDQPLRTCGGDWLLSLYEIPGASSSDAIDDVDFLVGLSIGVRKYHKDGTYETLMTTNDWVYSVDYHFTKNLLFYFTQKTILKTVLDPKLSPGASSPNKTVIKNPSTCDGFAVDWVHDRVYWANCSAEGAAIMSCGLDGEAAETVLAAKELNGKVVKRMAIDPYKGMLFWTADGELQSIYTSGENFNPNITNENIPLRAITLDMQSRRIYYVGSVNQTNSLYSVDYSGGDEVEHFSIPQLRSVYGLSVVGDKVFWVNYANVRDVIYEARLNLTSVDEVKSIKPIDRALEAYDGSQAVWHMRVVHPSLQTRPKIDPCLDKGCEHSCVTSSATSAKCQCPPGLTLNPDGVSCRVDSASSQKTFIGAIPLSILLVAAVVMTSAAVVYAWDKYWTLLEAKMSSISYSRSRGREEVGASPSEEDSVNLI